MAGPLSFDRNDKGKFDSVKVALRQPDIGAAGRWSGALETLPRAMELSRRQYLAMRAALPGPTYFPTFSYDYLGFINMPSNSAAEQLHGANRPLIDMLAIYEPAGVRKVFEQRMRDEQVMGMKMLFASVAAAAGSEEAATYFLDAMKETDYYAVVNLHYALWVTFLNYSDGPPCWQRRDVPDWLVELSTAILADNRFVTGLEKTNWQAGTAFTVSSCERGYLSLAESRRFDIMGAVLWVGTIVCLLSVALLFWLLFKRMRRNRRPLVESEVPTPFPSTSVPAAASCADGPTPLTVSEPSIGGVQAMRWQGVAALVIRPLCALGFIAGAVYLLRATSPRVGGVLELALQILAASLWLGLYFVGRRTRFTVAIHSAIGAIAGYLTGFIMAAPAMYSPRRAGIPAASLEEALLVASVGAIVGTVLGLLAGIVRRTTTKSLGNHAVIGLMAGFIVVALMGVPPIKWFWAFSILGDLLLTAVGAAVGTILGLVIGIMRRSVAKFAGASIRPSDRGGGVRTDGRLSTIVLTKPRLVQTMIFCIGVIALFPLCVTSTPVIDTDDIQETLSLANKDEAGPAGVATRRSFDVEATKKKASGKGRADRVVNVRFSPDGRTLRTVANNGPICTWDTTTMKRLRQIDIPPGHIMGHVESMGDIEPSDGRYALCFNAVDTTRPVQVIDLDTGNPACEVSLPFRRNRDALPHGVPCIRRVYWLADQEAMCVVCGESDHWWRFNYGTGKILAEGDLDIHSWADTAMINGLGEVAEDGKRLFLVEGGGKGSPPWRAGRINMKSLRGGEIGSIERPANGPFGLVPGGKYFYLGSHIYDRRSLYLVAAKEFPQDYAGIESIAFSPDGNHYAASVSYRDEDEHSKSLVLVHETLTLRTLLAFTAPAGVEQFRFSADGTKLAIAYDDGTLELWSIPAGRSERPGG